MNRTGIYIRISREDEDSLESESVSNQKKLLLKYIEDNHFCLQDVYIDDGYTGTNFNRPEFQRMIRNIKSKKLDIVVTKDLSRLGRDYIGTGELIERWFPANKIRYISILDGIDTSVDSSNNDIAPFKAIINDMYSKDNSKKIRAALKTKMLEGKWVGGCPPFGYKTDPNDRNHLIINMDEIKIVKKIFSLANKGYLLNQISNYLINNKIPTPTIIRKRKNNFKYSTQGYWSSTTIKQILTNPLYTGDMIQHRNSRLNYKIRKNIKHNCKDWIIVPNTHEAVVTKAQFKLINNVLAINRREKTDKTKPLLNGLLYCFECKKKTSICGEKNKYITCSTYRKYSKLHLCTSHHYNYKIIEEEVLKILQNILESNVFKEKINKIEQLSFEQLKSFEQDKKTLNKNTIMKLIKKIEIHQEKVIDIYFNFKKE